MPFDEIRLDLASGRDLDERVREVLLTVAHHGLAATAVLHHDRAVVRDVVFLHAGRLTIGVHVLDLDIPARVLVRAERVPEPLKAPGLVEHDAP